MIHLNCAGRDEQRVIQVGVEQQAVEYRVFRILPILHRRRGPCKGPSTLSWYPHSCSRPSSCLVAWILGMIGQYQGDPCLVQFMSYIARHFHMGVCLAAHARYYYAGTSMTPIATTYSQKTDEHRPIVEELLAIARAASGQLAQASVLTGAVYTSINQFQKMAIDFSEAKVKHGSCGSFKQKGFFSPEQWKKLYYIYLFRVYVGDDELHSYMGIMNHKPWVIRIPASKDESFMEGIRGIFSWLTWKGSKKKQ